jgi:uncharacterized membrane protein
MVDCTTTTQNKKEKEKVNRRMQLKGNKLFLLFIIIAIVTLISSITIDYFTPPETQTDYTEIIDYITIFSIILSVFFGFRKK